MNKFKLEDKVNVFSKNVSGKIAYIGKTHFSEGQWFGVILDEAKGRNNGCIDGHSYFNCPRNHGIFVRSCQLEKRILEKEPEKNSNVNRVSYPTCNNVNAKSNRSQGKIKADNKIKAMKTPKQQILPRNTSIKDLENMLKKQLKELSDIKSQKREADESIKNLETELQKMAEELNKRSRVENDLSKELTTAQRDAVVLNRKLRRTESNLVLSEKGRRKLHNTIEQLREITETAVIEKEIAEEKSEHLEVLMKDEADKCKTLEIEMEIMKEEMQLQYVNGVPAIHFVRMLENRNTVLYSALQKLKDLYQGLQQQLSEHKRTAEKNFEEIKCLKEVEKMKEQVISRCEEEVADLYDTINDMINADDIVFEVTEKNLNFESTISHLYEELHNAEDYLEISEEVEENLFEIKSICREEIEYLESKVKRTQRALEQQVLVHKSNEEVINKYRELTSILRDRNRKLSDEFERILKERKEAVITAENLKLKIYHERKKNLNDLIQVETMKHELESFKEELYYWSPFLPDNFFIEGGENSAIQVKLITSKMIKKLDLLIKLLRVSFQKYDVMKNEDLKSLTTKTRFLIFASQLQGFMKIYNKSFDFTGTEHFLILGKFHDILKRKNEQIEIYLSLLCKDEIDRQNCLDSIRETYCSLSQLLECKYAPKSEETMINLESCLTIILISCKCILFYCLAFEELDGITSDYRNNLKLLTEVVKKLKTQSRSILNCVKNCEREKLYFLPVVEKRVKADWQLISDSMNSLISIYQTFFADNKEYSSDTIDLENVSLKGINCNLKQIELDLKHLQKAINSGEFLVEQETTSQIISPICRWAQSKKHERDEKNRNFRNKIASCELEILDLSQSLRAREKQDKQINDEALRDASQQTEELDIKFEGGDNSTMTDYLRLKLQDMECSMKYLSLKNFELRVAPIKNHQNVLTPLKVLPKPKYPPEIHDICVLQKRLNKLSLNLRGIIVPLVVDITKKNSSKGRKYHKYLLERILISKEIEEEMWCINIDVKKLRKSSRCIWSNTNPFSLRNVRYVG